MSGRVGFPLLRKRACSPRSPESPQVANADRDLLARVAECLPGRPLRSLRSMAGQRACRRPSRHAVTIVRHQPVEAVGNPPRGRQHEQRTEQRPPPACTQECLRNSPGTSVHRSGRRHPQHLVLGSFSGDAEFLQVRELPRDDLATGPEAPLSEPHRGGAETAISVEDEHRLSPHDSIMASPAATQPLRLDHRTQSVVDHRSCASSY